MRAAAWWARSHDGGGDEEEEIEKGEDGDENREGEEGEREGEEVENGNGVDDWREPQGTKQYDALIRDVYGYDSTQGISGQLMESRLSEMGGGNSCDSEKDWVKCDDDEEDEENYEDEDDGLEMCSLEDDFHEPEKRKVGRRRHLEAKVNTCTCCINYSKREPTGLYLTRMQMALRNVYGAIALCAQSLCGERSYYRHGDGHLPGIKRGDIFCYLLFIYNAILYINSLEVDV